MYKRQGDNKGQQDKVLKVEAEKQRAIVEWVNLCKKATKPNAQNPQGGIVEKEAPIHVSKDVYKRQGLDGSGAGARYHHYLGRYHRILEL